MVRGHLALLYNLPSLARGGAKGTHESPFCHVTFVPLQTKSPAWVSWENYFQTIHGSILFLSNYHFKTDWVLQLKKQQFLIWGLVYKLHGWKYMPAQGFFYSWGWRNEQSQGPKRPTQAAAARDSFRLRMVSWLETGSIKRLGFLCKRKVWVH